MATTGFPPPPLILPPALHSPLLRLRGQTTRSRIRSSADSGSGPTRTHQYSTREVLPAPAANHSARLSRSSSLQRFAPPHRPHFVPGDRGRIYPGAFLAAPSAGVPLPSYAALSGTLAATAGCASAMERGPPVLGSAPRETRCKASPQQLCGDIQLPCSRFKVPLRFCSAPDGGSRYRRTCIAPPPGCTVRKRETVCCKTGGSEARGVRGGFS